MERNSREIKVEIEKYKASLKKIKSVIPLVTTTVLFFIIFFSIYNSHLLITIGGIIATCMYSGSFVWAHFKCKANIKELEDQLDNSN